MICMFYELLRLSIHKTPQVNYALVANFGNIWQIRSSIVLYAIKRFTI